jgi:hypothetical protein
MAAGTRYCPNMKTCLVLVLFMLFTAGAFAQPYRYHRHHRRYHHHVIDNGCWHSLHHHRHALIVVR